MRAQWPHAGLTENTERRNASSPAQQRTKTRYLPLERHEPLPAPADVTMTLLRPLR